MKKIYFLTLHRPDRSPSQRYRFEQYIGFMQQNGFETEHVFLLNAADDKLFYTGSVFSKLLILIKSIFILFKAYFSVTSGSIFFVQRECFMLGTAFFEKLFAKKGKLVFDFDDAIWLQNISEQNKMFAFLKNSLKTKEIILVSDLVIAGNSYLAHYALQFNSNVHVIPSTVDTGLYNPLLKKRGEKVIIGWTGSRTTYKYLDLIMPLLIKLKTKYSNLAFKIISEQAFRIEELGITTDVWSSEKEVEQLSEIDIGIMPLPDDEWTKGKCGFKGLQYMAMEIPAVMSAVGMNTEIVQDGVNGFLVHTAEEWSDVLCRLIESQELRNAVGKEGRKTVEEKYSVAANRSKYLSLLSSL